MQVLGIETTGEKLSIGVIENAKCKANSSAEVYPRLVGQGFPDPSERFGTGSLANSLCGKLAGRDEKENIVEIIKNSKIELEEIDGIAVSIGPGSFTGMRVGLAVAKGFAISLNKPVVGIPVLDAFMPGIEEQLKMQSAKCKTTNNKLAIMEISPIIDAKKERVYTAIYEFNTESLDWKRKNSFWIMRIDEFLDSIKEERILVGNGVSVYREQIKKAGESLFIPIPFASGFIGIIEPNIEFPTGVWVAKLGYERFVRGESDSVDELDGIYI